MLFGYLMMGLGWPSAGLVLRRKAGRSLDRGIEVDSHLNFHD